MALKLDLMAGWRWRQPLPDKAGRARTTARPGLSLTLVRGGVVEFGLAFWKITAPTVSPVVPIDDYRRLADVG